MLFRYMAGQKEYEVELQFTSGLLGAPDRTKTKEENIDGEKAIFGSRSDMGSPAFSHSSRTDSVISAGREADGSSSALTEKPPMLVVDQPENSSGGSSSKRKVNFKKKTLWPHFMDGVQLPQDYRGKQQQKKGKLF